MSNRVEEKQLPVRFAGLEHYVCLICSATGADRHVLFQEEDAHRYGGVSFHSSCFDLSAALREVRHEKFGQ